MTALTNVRAVLPTRVTDPLTIVIDDGTITDMTEGPAPAGAVDGHGALLLPGLIDTHSDGLEKEISPRRTARFPLDYALRSFEGRVRAAGVTTVCHGIGYQEKPRVDRTVAQARKMCAAINGRRRDASAGLDHRVLYRFEARDEHALEPLLQDLTADDTIEGAAPLLSFEDHTPGQGQFRDIEQYEAAVDPTQLPEGETVKSHVARLMAEAEAVREVRDINRARLTPLAKDGSIRLLAHDLETLDDVDEALDAGASIAEFPLSVDVAKRARDAGMTTVMGAPNALRGKSHSGNTSARELIAAGLCDVLASDYMPSAMLASVFAMAADRTCTLPEAVALVTAGPAAMIGGAASGRLEIGQPADLTLVDDSGDWPVVLSVHRGADHPVRAGLGA
ncbi:MAG: alpha-D-ribose 1-methylphosphonate 5-triphosphate diphosphatase [Actinomycetota bacterium]